SWSDTGYCNAAYDRLYQEQGVAVNPQKRLKIVDQMQQMIYNQRPYIVITNDDEIDAWSTHFAGIVESPQSFFNSLSLQSLTFAHQPEVPPGLPDVTGRCRASSQSASRPARGRAVPYREARCESSSQARPAPSGSSCCPSSSRRDTR